MTPKRRTKDPFLVLIGLFKLAKAIFFICTGLALLHYLHHDIAVRLQSLMQALHVDEENHVARWILDKAGKLTNTNLVTLSAICFLYATLDIIEGTGLYLQKRWAEWFVVIATAALLPIEAYAIYKHVTLLKILLTIGNLIIVGYLIYIIKTKPTHKRLPQ